MNLLPFDDESTLLVRTDFSDQSAWEALRRACQEGLDDVTRMCFVDDPAHEGATVEQLLELVSEEETFVLVADHVALSQDDAPLLAVDTFQDSEDEDDEGEEEEEEEAWEGYGQALRVGLTGLRSVVVNLSLANTDFEEFAESADADGVFRGIDSPFDDGKDQELLESFRAYRRGEG
ncbi:hypothetical protein CUT44_12575 [Streptomyces carminius]|uniref:DUF6924 domain-containing protein n=1 Tax=Streptomyces carminius TaxID=2665496 RepID=A0A2M8LZW5_9ACTN|nr:hypothetical protein [Streptomyces carminius]PJE97507.1 hypothetical protein CUT44_12575 [Streptomyces carminius]